MVALGNGSVLFALAIFIWGGLIGGRSVAGFGLAVYSGLPDRGRGKVFGGPG